MCDHPDRSLNDYLNELRGLVRRYGWAVQTVGGEGKHPPFAYTVGLTAQDAPELFVSGLPSGQAATLLNEMACRVRHSSGISPGERIHQDDGSLLEVVRVAEPTVHLLLAVQLYGRDVHALQLVHADDRGTWPWDIGHRGNQRVLGAREAFPG